MIRSGDRVDVVLDVIMEDDTYRVVMVGVFEPHETAPPMPEGSVHRNRVQTFMSSYSRVRAFALGRGGRDE